MHNDDTLDRLEFLLLAGKRDEIFSDSNFDELFDVLDEDETEQISVSVIKYLFLSQILDDSSSEDPHVTANIEKVVGKTQEFVGREQFRTVIK